MKRLAMITAVLLGAASAAQAWPTDVHGKIIIKTDNDRTYRDRDYHRDHDYHRGYQARRWDRARFHGRYAANNWQMLGDNLSAQNKGQELWLNGASFDQLVLQVEDGAPLITAVGIDYGNNNTQLIKLNRQLGRFGRDSAVVDVNGRGRPIQRIVVYSEPRFGGSYSVLAR